MQHLNQSQKSQINAKEIELLESRNQINLEEKADDYTFQNERHSDSESYA